jgi:hypothetical protein
MGLVILEELTVMLQHVLHIEILPSKIESEVLQQVKNQKTRDKKILKLGKEQNILIKNALNDGYSEFDITLLYTLLRNLKCVNIIAPTQGWGTSKMPGNGETTLGDDIERIRLIRNEVWAHASVPSLPVTKFQELWSIISDICSRMQNLLGKNYVQRLKNAETRSIDEDMENEYIEKIRKLKGKLRTKCCLFLSYVINKH